MRHGEENVQELPRGPGAQQGLSGGYRVLPPYRGSKGSGEGQTLRNLGPFSAVTSRKGTKAGAWQGEHDHHGESRRPA